MPSRARAAAAAARGSRRHRHNRSGHQWRSDTRRSPEVFAPNEVTGHVTEHAGSVLAAVEWPLAPASAGGSTPAGSSRRAGQLPRKWRRILPARSRGHERRAARRVLRTSARTICDFVTALGDLYALEEKDRVPPGRFRTGKARPPACCGLALRLWGERRLPERLPTSCRPSRSSPRGGTLDAGIGRCPGGSGPVCDAGQRIEQAAGGGK